MSLSCSLYSTNLTAGASLKSHKPDALCAIWPSWWWEHCDSSHAQSLMPPLLSVCWPKPWLLITMVLNEKRSRKGPLLLTPEVVTSQNHIVQGQEKKSLQRQCRTNHSMKNLVGEAAFLRYCNHGFNSFDVTQGSADLTRTRWMQISTWVSGQKLDTNVGWTWQLRQGYQTKFDIS